MRFLRLVLGPILSTLGAGAVFCAARVVGSAPIAGFIVVACGVALFVAGLRTLLGAILPDESRRAAVVHGLLALLIVAVAALPGLPWQASVVAFVLATALALMPVALWGVLCAAVRGKSDPFDPEEPPDPMVEPDPDPEPTLNHLLACKRSLDLARAR